jgi:hypothetical protein
VAAPQRPTALRSASTCPPGEPSVRGRSGTGAAPSGALIINPDKSAVARPEDRHFLGFCLRREPQTAAVVVLLSARTKRDAMARIRELTPRGWGGTLESWCIAEPEHRVGRLLQLERRLERAPPRRPRASFQSPLTGGDKGVGVDRHHDILGPSRHDGAPAMRR